MRGCLLVGANWWFVSRSGLPGKPVNPLLAPARTTHRYKAADWWRLLATSSSSSSSNTGGGGSWGPDARPLAAAAGLTDPAAASALLRAVWHALHSPNAAPDVQSPVPVRLHVCDRT